MKAVLNLIAWAGLAMCLIAPMLYLHDAVTNAGFKQTTMAGTVIWFVFATAAAYRKTGR